MLGFPGGTSGKESTCQCRRHKRCGFNPLAGKIPWRWKWQPTPVFLPGKIPWKEEPGGLQSIGLQRVGHNWVHQAHRAHTPYTKHTHYTFTYSIRLVQKLLWFCILKFAIWSWNTFLNKCGYVIHYFNVHFSLHVFLLMNYYLLFILYLF